MAVAAIAIGNLSTAALYVSSFHVEVFSDATYTTLVDSQSCPAVKDSSGKWIQSEMIGVSGLVRGNTYYIQAGPVSPGGVANFSRYSVVAGTITVPDCTYAGTFSSTTAGITYDILPGNVPTDLDHFEAIWTKDGSAPSNSSLENAWIGTPLGNGFLHLFAGGSAGQTIHLFCRAVSTSGGYQNWFAVDNRVVSTASTGSTDASGITYADGQTVESLKPGQAGADITGANTAADTSAVNGINAGHISDTAVSIGFLGKWWRTSSSNQFPSGGGELAYAPMFTTHDAFINYNIFTYDTFAGSIPPPSFAPYGPNNDGKWIYVRWTGYFTCTSTGSYAFGTNSDDGANLYVNGTQLVHDLNGGHGANSNLTPQQSGTITLTAGDVYEIVVEYTNNAGGAGIQVVYTPPGTTGWQILNLGTAYTSAAFSQYKDGTPVDALQPAAAGADVTAVNISADTATVGGRAAGDVSNTILAGGGTNYLHDNNQNIPQNLNNLVNKGTFEDGSPGVWAAGTHVAEGGTPGFGFTKALVCNNRDTIEGNNYFSVSSGQRVYCSAVCDTENIPPGYGACAFGIRADDAAGGQDYIAAAFISEGQQWTALSGYITVPSGCVRAIPWIQIGHDPGSINPGAFFYITNIFYSKTPAVDFSEPTHINKNADNIPYADGTTIQALKPAQVGADVTGANTAANTTHVGTTPATDVQNTVNPGGGVDFNNPGNTNKNLGNIPDGSGRYAAVETGADNTRNHVLTTYAGFGVGPVSGVPEVPTQAWSVISNDTSDTFNVTSTIMWSSSQNGADIQIVGMVDGNGSTSFGYGTQFDYTGDSSKIQTVTFFGSVTGLSPGTHLIALYYWSPNGSPITMPITYTHYGVLQQISS